MWRMAMAGLPYDIDADSYGDAYSAGQRAFLDGRLSSQCPYPKTSSLSDVWLKGWHTAYKALKSGVPPRYGPAVEFLATHKKVKPGS